MNGPLDLLEAVQQGHRPTSAEAQLFERVELPVLLRVAVALRDRGHGNRVSFSRKVFLPLTHLCRDRCHYCVFARPPEAGSAPFMSREEVLAEARRGAGAGCKEALFTLGDKPELRYQSAAEALRRLGHATTLSYLREMADAVLRETGLLPHLNPGVMTREDLSMLRPVSASMGLMLESTSERLLAPGQAHHGSPDKVPSLRLDTLRAAGELSIPFTSGILIGIGESRAERLASLISLRDLHDRFGHLQETIIQNFRAKPETAMAGSDEPELEDLLWTIAVARLVLGPDANIQAPPNLSSGALPRLIAAGINDWGGVSPVTPDYVNPEAPWPQLDDLRRETRRAGKELVERLTIYPAYAQQPERWLDEATRPSVLRQMDAEGFAREDAWTAGGSDFHPRHAFERRKVLSPPLEKALRGNELTEAEIVDLFRARGEAFAEVAAAADALRERVNGDQVGYVVNRNINYTNICTYHCRFCAFSHGKEAETLRGKPYLLHLDEVVRRAAEAWERGATEVCLQGGIHPDYTGDTYLQICRAIKSAVPRLHIHAFSPLEVWNGAETLGLSVEKFLARLQEAGLGTLPGTAAEILDDEVRQVICPDKLTTSQWTRVMSAAHGLGIRSTATIMFGHVDQPRHWARHLLGIRRLQERTHGFTEFVPLPFVHMEAPLYLKGAARRGPTFREALLMHSVARLVLHPLIPNIQASWVKMGRSGVEACLAAGANDLGGTLMEESITRAAGASHGQEVTAEEMVALARRAGRIPFQRTTIYGRIAA